MKLDFDNQEVTVLPAPVDAVRDWFENPNNEFGKKLVELLDGTQGFVFSGEGPTAYLVIEVVKEEPK